MQKHRTHYRLIWKHLRKYLLETTKLPEPDTCSKYNQHGGVMPAMRDEFGLTDRQAGEILDKMGTGKAISYESLKGVSGMLGYLYQLKTGKEKENWPDVKIAMSSFLPKDFSVKKSMVPEKIPTPPQMKTVLTKDWTPACGMSFARWVTGLLACWCWGLWGCRPNVDLDSLKKSESHTFNPQAGWASTAYLGGRNKLPGKKQGTRPWSAFFVCMCDGGVHKPVPPNWEFTIGRDGNPRQSANLPFCSCCPLNCLDLKHRRSGVRPMHLFSKWTKTSITWGSNHGDVVAVAFEFMRAQGIEPDFDRHAGRKSLAAILEELGCSFQVGFEIHGDNPDVWVEHYQPNLHGAMEFKRRKQSMDPRVATAALRMWRHYCGKDRKPRIPQCFESFQTRLMVRVLREMGKGHAVEEEIEAHEAQDN